MASNVHWVPSCNATLEVYVYIIASCVMPLNSATFSPCLVIPPFLTGLLVLVCAPHDFLSEFVESIVSLISALIMIFLFLSEFFFKKKQMYSVLSMLWLHCWMAWAAAFFISESFIALCFFFSVSLLR